nr:hypothetical protein [Tanacetum cinerariifolium]
MHNNIMAAGSRDHPSMLATRRYAQWQSRFLRYIDARPNGDALRKCILEGPYTPFTVIIPAKPATDDSPEVPERTAVEIILNMSPENKAHCESEKEAIHLLLTRIGDKIYSTVDACKTAHEMWIVLGIKLITLSHVTTEEKAQKKNHVKARCMLLMELPNEHLMTFNQYKDAKSLFAAIKQDLVLVHEDLEQIHEDDLEEIDLKWQLALLSMRVKRFFHKTRKKITINGSDTAGFDKSKVECYKCHKMGHFVRECRGPRNQDSKNRYQDSSRRTVHVEETPPKAMVAIDGVGFYWSYMAEDKVPTNMAFMDFLDSEVQDYALWDVIESGNSFVPVTQTTTAKGGAITTTISSLVIAEEKIKKKNDVKERSMLLMALPNEHLMTFNQYKDAKSLFAAIETRFGGNEAIKKTQKTLLKQMYENFSATST